MNNRFKFRIPMFTDKGTFTEFQYIELGEQEECTLCGYNGAPQQCTGLKDKNGTLIFEGDVVKDDHDALHYVRWVYDSWQLFPCTQNNYTIGIVDDEIEVIGNIYDNKELLNERN